MKLIKEVSAKQVKRCFVASQYIRGFRVKGRYLGVLTHKEYLRRLESAKKYVNKLSEKKLDYIIGKEYEKRRLAYNASHWYLATVSLGEVGVWHEAGGMPKKWTDDSLKETAKNVARALKRKDKRLRARSRRAIPGILKFEDIIRTDPYLLPIVFKSGTGTNGRRKCRKKMKGDIDDGCMRSVALATTGNRKLLVYFGLPKRNRLS